MFLYIHMPEGEIHVLQNVNEGQELIEVNGLNLTTFYEVL